MAIVMFALSHHLRDIRKSNKIPKFWSWKWRSRSRSRKRGTGLVPLGWNYPISYRWFFRILLPGNKRLRQLGHMHTFRHSEKHTHTYKPRHTQTQIQSLAMTRGEICNTLQICLKIYSSVGKKWITYVLISKC